MSAALVEQIRAVLPYASLQQKAQIFQLLSARQQAVERERQERISSEQQESEWNLMGERIADWNQGSLLWLTKYTKTEDTHWLTKNTSFLAPFPKKEYLRVVLDILIHHPALFVIKSREMMMSWLISSYIAWMCQWYPVFWVAQTGKEDKVAELIEYARTLVRNQPEWMRERNPLVVDNETELKWAKGGRFLGLPKGEDQVRIHHPYGYFQDESGFLPEAQASHDAVRPVCKQVICVSSDSMGWFHDETKL